MADPTPAPVPPAALDAAIEAVKATQWVTFKAGDNWTSTAASTPEVLAGAVLTAVAPILLAAGREQAAVDIAEKLDAMADDEAQRPNRDDKSYVIEGWLREAAGIAALIDEGPDHG